jgi:hypothetical protein
VRFAATLLLWLIATLALAVTIPAAWTQLHVVDADGYAALAQQAATDPAVRSAMASELSSRAMTLIAERGGGRSEVEGSEVQEAARAFTVGPAFPPLFAQANRAAHGWLFSDPGSDKDGNQWAVDVAPMLNDGSIQPLLARHNVVVPAKLTVPLTVSVPHSMQQGRLSRLSRWGPWITLGAAALCGLCALLTVAAARRRGKALSSLGIAALLVGAGGWAGIELAGRYVHEALNRTTGNVRQVAEAMIEHAEAGLHQWLDATLIGGAALVAIGVVAAMLGSLAKKS